jgi:hypothetical protein
MKTRCASLLLLHTLAVVGVVSLQPTVNPRGWQAARQAEQQRAAASAAATAAAVPEVSLTPAPAVQQPSAKAPLLPVEPRQPALPSQQTCSLPQLPPGGAEAQAARWWASAALLAFVSFAAGLATGMQLHSWLIGSQQPKQPELAKQPEALSRAGSCPTVPQLRPDQHEATQPAQGMEPAGAIEAEQDAGAVYEQQGQQQQAPDGASQAESQGSMPSLPPDGSEAVPEAAAEAAVVAAVQEMVLHKGTADTSGTSLPAAQEATPGGMHQPAHEQQQPGGGQQGLAPQQPALLDIPDNQQPVTRDLPLTAVAARGKLGVGVSDHFNAQEVLDSASDSQGGGGTLGALGDDDRTDVAAAAQLVLTMCRSLRVDPGQLSQGERLQVSKSMSSCHFCTEQLSDCALNNPGSQLTFSSAKLHAAATHNLVVGCSCRS